MGLSATVAPVKLDTEKIIPRLLRLAHEMNGLSYPPEAAEALSAALH